MKKITVLSTALLLITPVLSFAQRNATCPYQDRGLTGPGLMWILLLLMIGALIFIAIQFSKQRKEAEKSGNHIDILKKRYASGEISKEEFDKLKDDLI